MWRRGSLCWAQVEVWLLSFIVPHGVDLEDGCPGLLPNIYSLNVLLLREVQTRRSCTKWT